MVIFHDQNWDFMGISMEIHQLHGIMGKSSVEIVAFRASFGCWIFGFKPEEFCEWNVYLHTVHYCTLKCELYLVVPLCLYSRNLGYVCS